MLFKVVFLFTSVILYKFLRNYVACQKMKKFRSDYLRWIKTPDDSLFENRNEIIRLIKAAGVGDSVIPVSQAVNPLQIVSHTTSVIDNFPTTNASLAASMSIKFDEAVGVYKHRYHEAFSPLYWIETTVFLPKSLILYIGLDLENPAFKLCNVLLTIIWLGVLFIFYLFGNDFYHLVSDFISQLP